MSNLKEEIVDYAPDDDSDVPSTNILLIGQIGAGKSSFFNSVNSIFRGKITSQARSGSFEHSLTTVVSQCLFGWILVKSSDINMKFSTISGELLCYQSYTREFGSILKRIILTAIFCFYHYNNRGRLGFIY